MGNINDRPLPQVSPALGQQVRLGISRVRQIRAPRIRCTGAQQTSFVHPCGAGPSRPARGSSKSFLGLRQRRLNGVRQEDMLRRIPRCNDGSDLSSRLRPFLIFLVPQYRFAETQTSLSGSIPWKSIVALEVPLHQHP